MSLPIRNHMKPQTVEHHKTGPAVQRVIHHIDYAGRVVQIDIEPVTAVGMRKTAIVQTHELIRAANELIFALQSWEDKYFSDAERRQGYVIAVEEIRAAEQTQKLRDAIADLRPYLAIMSKDAIRETGEI